MRFDEIPGKLNEKSYLIDRVKDGNVPHALIFKEEEGSGALLLVLSFVQFLFCNNRQGENPCNECSSCTKVKKLIHPDIHFAFPVIKAEKKKREDTTSADFLEPWRTQILENPFFNLKTWMRRLDAIDKSPDINVTECNNIMKTLGLKSFESPYKVQIIWQAEFLGKNGNRLLKLIEEPPEQTIIILITSKIESVLNTILSRCQRVNVSQFEDREIREYLVEKEYCNEEIAEEVSFLSNGNMAKAIELSTGNIQDYSEQMLQWFRICYQFGSKPTALIQWIDQFSRFSKTEQRSFIEYSLNFFREYLSFINGGSNNLRLNSSEKETAQKMTKIIDFERVVHLQQLFTQLLSHLLRNANVKIAMMDVSIKVHKVLVGKKAENSSLIY